MTDILSGQVDAEDLRRFHWLLRRGLLMHRKGRLGLFFKLQFPQVMFSEDAEHEVATQLDLTKWFAAVPFDEIAQHPSYVNFLGALEAAMDLAKVSLDKASSRQLDMQQFRGLIQALQEFDRCADMLDAVVTNSLTDVDALTGLFNRAALDRDLKREMAIAQRSEKPISVAMIDADKFKAVNDTHGHCFGDVVLSRLAERFLESLRPSDLLYRYGGEEFLVLLPDTTPEQAHAVLERLRKRAGCAPIFKGDISVTQTVSVGITMLVGEDSHETVVARADEALYSAKAQGRNRIVVASAR